MLAPLLPTVDPTTTPQQVAYKGSVEAVERQLAERFVTATTIDSDGRSLLHWAAAGGRDDTVAMLLRLPGVVPALVNKQDDGGWTPLTSAAASGSGAVVAALLGAGADANIATETGTLPLHHTKGRAHIIKLLLPATRDPNARDGAGATALHRAAGAGHTDAVAALLAGGANVNATDGRGATPLHVACEEARLDVVRLLLEHGARATAKAADGRDALAMCPDARVRGTVASLLRAATAS